MTTPLLIISDSPTGTTGLGRITRELAARINKMPEFNLAVAGIGGYVSYDLGYRLYPVYMERDYSIPQLPGIWRDFAKDQPGIVLCILNACWLRWLARPETTLNTELSTFLESAKLRKWCYVPVDSESIGGRLPEAEVEVLEQMDRILAYTKFGEQVIAHSISQPDNLTHLPHGCDASIFHPRPRSEARATEFCRRILKTEGRLSPQTFLLGICATNTPRKDWGLAFETCAELKVRGEPIGIWAHTDRITGAWDLEAMVKSFGLRDDMQFTIGNLSDEDMAWGLSACDVVLGIGAGEGWGLVNSESLACGVPCISFDYAGVKEFTHPDLLIKPASWRWDGFFCNQRPIGSASEWADRAVAVKGKLFDLDPQFYWDNCWPRWEAWLKEGL